MIASGVTVVFVALFASIPYPLKIVEERGKVMCSSADGYEHKLTTLKSIFIVLDFMLPAFTLICFNIAIVVRLQKIKRIYKAMTRQHAALSLNSIPQRSSNTATSTRSKSADVSLSGGYTVDNNDFTTT